MMKNTTLITVLILCFIGFVNTVYAQDKLEEYMNETTPEERAQLQTDYMKENLVLTSDQEPKIHAINLKYSQKMQDAYSNGGKFQKLKKMKSISADKDKEVKGVLSASQYATYEKNKEEMKERVRARAKEKKKGD